MSVTSRFRCDPNAGWKPASIWRKRGAPESRCSSDLAYTVPDASM